MPLNATAMAETIDRALIANKFGIEKSTPQELIVMAHANDNPHWLLEIGFSMQSSLRKAGLIDETLQLTPRGVAFSHCLSNTLPRRSNISLQNTIRNLRSDLRAVSRSPQDLRWWARNMLWQFRTWWRGTDPEVRQVIDGGELKPFKLWTSTDDARQAEQWLESRFSAFWLCPSGPMDGVDHLKEVDKLKEKHGDKCLEAAQAIGSVAKLSAAIEAKPKLAPWVQTATPQEIAIKRAEKAAELVRKKIENNLNTVSRLAGITGNNGCGNGNSGSTISDDVLKSVKIVYDNNLAFINEHNGLVEAKPSALEIADAEVTKSIKDAVLRPNKNNRHRPQTFTLIHEFYSTMAKYENKQEALRHKMWEEENPHLVGYSDEIVPPDSYYKSRRGHTKKEA